MKQHEMSGDGNVIMEEIDLDDDIEKTDQNWKKEGYEKGYERGYEGEGYERGHRRERHESEGHEREGYSKEGYEREGHERKGHDRKGYERKGYAKEGEGIIIMYDLKSSCTDEEDRSASEDRTDIQQEGRFHKGKSPKSLRDQQRERHEGGEVSKRFRCECYTIGSYCCGSVVWLCGFVCCISRRSLKRRLAMMWFWVIAVSTFSITYMYIYLFPASSVFKAAPGDMRVITKQYTAVMCQQISVQSGNNFEAYVVRSSQQISYDIYPNNFNIKKQIESFQNIKWKFYVVAQSMVNISLCLTSPTKDEDREAILYLLRGASNKEEFEEDGCRATSCVLRQWRIPVYDNKCNEASLHSETFQKSDDYYFILDNPYKNGINVEINFSLLRRFLSLSKLDINQDCHGGLRQCVFELEPFSSEKVVYRAPDNIEFDTEVQVHCTPNSYVLLSVLLLPYVICSLITTISLLLPANCRKQMTGQLPVVDETRCPLINSNSSNYDSVQLIEPDYILEQTIL